MQFLKDGCSDSKLLTLTGVPVLFFQIHSGAVQSL